ncbi:uncharacterized protein N7459_002568 [Penicillium hispanicum]|uniref:uncharacterized protein n=1 Tax=Penicillium hispanicum TaxID=1080232 RepID=UPI002541DC6D|nr:uncharacterized protein N7459_002568 [Penicillium hispanicum]KAJ5586803.1 hypothetical protein N7459_002568 [Penicillium hispanicum]
MSSDSGSEDPNVVVIPVEDSLSDGSLDAWPKNDGRFDYRMLDDSRWRDALAEMWVQKTGAYEEGITYTLEKLPEGYALFDRARGTNPHARDTFLFGHPSGIYFQSRVTFFLHFYWLMTERAQPCECVPCARQARGGQPRKRRTKAEMEAAKGKIVKKDIPQRDPEWPCDEEGPDYWKIYLMQLKEKGTLAEEIKQPLNMDWVLTHEYLHDYFIRLKMAPAFVPRRGETVLWTPTLDGKLEFHEETRSYQIRGDDGEWRGMPDWRAGIVTQVPEEPSNLLDIVQLTDKENPLISYSGFRVETLPDPLSDDKSYSLHYKYVPLMCIKPFSCYERFLFPTPREQLHPSIENALTTMSSWSMLSNIRFQGTWPNAQIHSRGIWVGPEMLALYDTVRLKPFGLTAQDMEEGKTVNYEECDPVDVLVIEKIWLQLDGCNADPKSQQLAEQCTPLIAGKVYTRDKNRLDRPIPFDKDPLQEMSYNDTVNAFRQVGMSLYGPWYRVAGGRTCVVSQIMLLGRCYEPDAMLFHFGNYRLDYDLHGIMNGRRYSSQADARIPKGIEWFWGDNRVETLGLATMNGVEVGDAAEQRENLAQWQAILKILNGPYNDADLKVAGLPNRVGRPSTKKTFGEVSKTSKLVSSGLGGNSGSGDDEDDNQSEEVNDNVSEMDLSETELTAPIPFRGGTEETEGGDYDPLQDSA